MFKSITRGVVAIVASLGLLAGESRACCFCHCFDWCKPAPVPVATYAPAACPAPAPACNVCPQQVNYVPQTCYRTSYTCVPVTTCKPVTVCDPCGNPQTVMQPVTTYVQRPVMVPYTTMRPVVSTVNFAPAPCSTCGGSSCGTCSACSGGAAYSSPYYGGSAVAGYSAAPTSGCSSCGGGSAVSYSAPAETYATPGPATTPMYGAPPMGTPTMPAPAMGAPPVGTPTPAMPSNGVPSTFQSAPSSSSSSYPATPVPDAADPKVNSSFNTPRLLDPQNRTTSTGPMIGPATVTNAIFMTADRSRVFHPASQQTTDGWSEKPAASDGWQSTDGK